MTTRSQARRTHPRIELLEGRALLSAGDLDLTFGGTGYTLTRPYNINLAGPVSTMAVGPDLKTVLAGYGNKTVTVNRQTTTYQYVDVQRLNADGSIDATFGDHGTFTFQLNPSSFSTDVNAISLAVQGDGKILATSIDRITLQAATKKTPAVTRLDISVLRLNPDGTLDTTFHNTGQSLIDIPAKGDLFSSGVMVRPADGKIVVGGWCSGEHGMLAVRLNPDGTLDTTFGPNGQGWVSTVSGKAYCMGTDSAGDILLGGRDTNNVPAIVRFTASGLPDTSFGSGGEVLFPSLNAGFGVWGVGTQSSGKVVFALDQTPQNAYGYASVGRINADGTTDTTFGSGGLLSDTSLIVYSLAVQADDKILLSGKPSSNTLNTGNALTADRVLADGQSLDSAFGIGGKVSVSIPNTTAVQTATISLRPDGKITMAGLVTANGVPDAFGTTRLLNDSAPASGMVQALALAGTAPTSRGPVGASALKLRLDGSVRGSFTSDRSRNLLTFSASGRFGSLGLSTLTGSTAGLVHRGTQVAGSADLSNARGTVHIEILVGSPNTFRVISGTGAYAGATGTGTIVLGTKAAPNRITLRSR